MQDEGFESGGAAAVAVLATIAIGASLILVRDHVHNAVLALLLAAVVVISGALGGRRAGVGSALAAAISFNFFHTQPYLSLRIHDFDDVITTGTLLLVGLVSGFTSHVAGQRRADADEATRELKAIARVSGLVANGATPADVETAVETELLDLLKLTAFARSSAPGDGAVVLERSGSHASRHRVYHDGAFELPPDGVAIPVQSDGLVVGYITCTPRPGAVVTLAARRTSVLLADLLGASLAGAARRHIAPN
jgi:K+-sensing histidine kinase KdpD